MADRLAHAVFGLLFDTSPDAAFIVDRTSRRLVSANVRAADMLARPLDVLLGMPLAELVFEQGRDVERPGHYEEVALRRGDDYPVYVQLQVAHVNSDEHGQLAAYMARDSSERILLERELLAKHTALFMAHAELERAHTQVTETKAELELRNREIAMLAWRAAMGEVVAGIAHHLNNPVGALTSTARRLRALSAHVPDESRAEVDRLLNRVGQLARRIESSVAAIVQASRSNVAGEIDAKPKMPPELANALSVFSEQLDEIPTKEPQ